MVGEPFATPGCEILPGEAAAGDWAKACGELEEMAAGGECPGASIGEPGHCMAKLRPSRPSSAPDGDAGHWLTVDRASPPAVPGHVNPETSCTGLFRKAPGHSPRDCSKALRCAALLAVRCGKLLLSRGMGCNMFPALLEDGLFDWMLAKIACCSSTSWAPPRGISSDVLRDLCPGGASISAQGPGTFEAIASAGGEDMGSHGMA